MLGQQWAAGGGAGGVNGLGGQTMNAGFGGANGMNIGVMGYHPAGQAGLGGFTNQPTHVGITVGRIPVLIGGAVGANANGPRGPAANAAFFGVNVMQFGLGGNVPAGYAGIGRIGNQHPQGG